MELETAELLDKILKYLDKEKIRKPWLDILTDLRININKGENLSRHLKSRNYINERFITGTSKKIVYISETGKDFVNTSSFSHLIEKEIQENELKKLQLTNLELQNENFEYSKTIRKQEAIIRKLDIFAKTVELLKAFKWVIGALIGISLFLIFC